MYINLILIAFYLRIDLLKFEKKMSETYKNVYTKDSPIIVVVLFHFFLNHLLPE